MDTENLVARHLNMPCNGSVLADAIEGGHVKRFDGAQTAENGFLLMASAGIDAEVVRCLHGARGTERTHSSLELYLSSPADMCQIPVSGNHRDGFG